MRRLLFMAAIAVLPISADAQDIQLSVHAGNIPNQIGNDFLLNTFGCTGKNISPSMTWTKGPPDTKSYAVTLFDPDAPTGSGWWHWTVFNIPAGQLILPENAFLNAASNNGVVQGRNDFGQSAYGGPCPPEGSTHRYVFTVWALGIERLPIDKSASGAMVGYFLKANALASDSITLRDRRP